MRESVTNRNVRNKTLHRLYIYIDLSHMTVINSFLFCILAVDQSNAAPRRRLAIKA